MPEMLPANWGRMTPHERDVWRDRHRNLAQKVQPEFIGDGMGQAFCKGDR